MKKEIYIIKNRVNNKVYIGQSINSQSRFSHHISDGLREKGNSLIDAAIKKYGAEQFWYEVLEIVENYDERERYWIQYFNSLTPNGYNISGGGAGGGCGIDNAKSIIRDSQLLNQIVEDIQYSSLKLIEIGQKYNLSLRLISSINRGTAYCNDSLDYPLRKRYSDVLVEEINDLVAEELMIGSKTYRQLAKEYNVSTFWVGEVNNGKRSNNLTQDFPIRKKELDPIFEEIKIQLLNTNKSLRAIARDLNVPYSKVQSFNSGKYHHNDNIGYPIRQSRP